MVYSENPIDKKQQQTALNNGFLGMLSEFARVFRNEIAQQQFEPETQWPDHSGLVNEQAIVDPQQALNEFMTLRKQLGAGPRQDEPRKVNLTYYAGLNDLELYGPKPLLNTDVYPSSLSKLGSLLNQEIRRNSLYPPTSKWDNIPIREIASQSFMPTTHANNQQQQPIGFTDLSQVRGRYNPNTWQQIPSNLIVSSDTQKQVENDAPTFQGSVRSDIFTPPTKQQIAHIFRTIIPKSRFLTIDYPLFAGDALPLWLFSKPLPSINPSLGIYSIPSLGRMTFQMIGQELNKLYKRLNGKLGIIVDLSKINFQKSSLTGEKLRQSSKILNDVIVKTQKSGQYLLEQEVLIQDVGIVFNDYKLDPNMAFLYRALGVNLRGFVFVDQKAKTWAFHGDVTPNLTSTWQGYKGFYAGDRNLPIFDIFDPNLGNRTAIEERIFKEANRFEKIGFARSYPIIAKTVKDKNGIPQVIPGKIFLEGKL